MRVEVTEADVAAGHRCVATACPVALALRRAIGGDEPAVVGSTLFHYGPYPNRKMASLPPGVSLRIGAFDRGEGMTAPFSFEVELQAEDAAG